MDDQLNTSLTTTNWSEAVEDLLSGADPDAAVSLLESLITKLEASPDSDPQLASALLDLAEIHSSRGFSLKADHLRSRSSLIHHRLSSSRVVSGSSDEGLKKTEKLGDSSHGSVEKAKDFAGSDHGDSDDDWEAIADQSPDQLLSPQFLPGVSNLSLEETKPNIPKRRGRGTFSYKKQELYSDHLSESSVNNSFDNGDDDDDDDENVGHGSESNTEIRHSTYGTRHVLILADFSPSTKTIDLENLFGSSRDHGVAIRWINDTTALAVFRTPSLALEAKNRINCPFKVNVLEENDDLLISIPPKDLEPPRQRPKTSTRTAQRLIAQGMGLKLPSTSFGSRELRKQEGERKNRIVSRQKLKDDAWGTDD